MKKIHPNFEQEKVNMFEETELPVDLKGLIINSIKKEKRKNIYKEIIAAAAVLLLIIVPGYFYLSHNDNNAKKDVAVNLKTGSDAGAISKNNEKTKSIQQTGEKQNNDSNKKYSDSSNSKSLNDKGKYGTDVESEKNILVGNVSENGYGKNGSSKKTDTCTKKNLNSSNKSNGKSDKNKKSDIYSGKIAINQPADNLTKGHNNLARSADGKSAGSSLENSNNSEKTSVDKGQNPDDNETIYSAQLSDNPKSIARSNQNNNDNITNNNNQTVNNNMSLAKTPDSGELALAKTGSNNNAVSTANSNVDANAADKSNLKVGIMAKSNTQKTVITINFDSTIEIQELEDMIKGMDIKDYEIKDNEIDINCSINEYENIKSSLDVTYQDKVKYVVPEDISKDKNALVKLILKF